MNLKHRPHLTPFLRGFTIVELLIVVALLGLLSTAAYYPIVNERDKKVLQSTVDQVVSHIQDTQTRSINYQDQRIHGILIETDPVTLRSQLIHRSCNDTLHVDIDNIPECLTDHAGPPPITYPDYWTTEDVYELPQTVSIVPADLTNDIFEPAGTPSEFLPFFPSTGELQNYQTPPGADFAFTIQSRSYQTLVTIQAVTGNINTERLTRR